MVCLFFFAVLSIAETDSLKSSQPPDSLKSEKRKPVIKMPDASSRDWVQSVISNQKAEARADSIRANTKDTSKTPYELVAGKKMAILPLIIMRPITEYSSSSLKNWWLLYLCETYLHFKLGVVPALRIISPDTLSALLFNYKEYKKVVPLDDYRDVARKLAVPYLLYLECKDVPMLQSGGLAAGNDVNILGKLSSVDGDVAIANVSTQCALKDLGPTLDRFMLDIVDKLGIPPEKQNRAFLETALLGDKKNSMKKLGEMLVAEKTIPEKEFQKFLKQYNEVLAQDKQMSIGYYAGAKFCDARKEYPAATDFSNTLVIQLQQKYPPAFLMTIRFYRLIQKYEDALRMIARAEGIEGIEDTLMREKARCYAATGDKREAADLYAQILKKDKKHFDALLYCAQAANNNSKAQDALSYANRLLKVAPNNREGLFEKAKALNSLANYEEALQCLTTLLSGGKADAQVYLLAGDIHALQNNTVKAIELYDQYLNSQPKDAAVLLKLAKLQTTAKQYRGVVESYQALFDIDKNAYKDQLIEAGMLLENEKNISGAKAAYQKFLDAGFEDEKVTLRLARITFQEQGYQQTSTLLRKLPENSLTLEYKKMLGISYFKTDLDELAMPQLEAVFKKEPGDKQLMEMLAQLYDKKQNYKKAIELYASFLSSSNTGNAEYAYKLGSFYEKQNQIKEAMNRYTDNIKQYPDQVENYEALCRLYISQKNYDAAQKLLAQASNLSGLTSLSSKMHGQVAAATGRPGDAIRYYSAYLSSKPNDTLIWCDLFDLQFTMKNTALALEAAENAGTFVTGNPQYYFKLGSAYHEIGKCEQAVPFLEKVRGQNTDKKKILLMLADCYKAMNIEWKLHTVNNELATMAEDEKKK